MLAERPLTCGVPPGFRVAEEAETDLLFDEAWDEWLAERFDGGDDVLLAAIDSGIPLAGADVFQERASVRGLARALVDFRDLAPLTAAESVDPRAGWRSSSPRPHAGRPHPRCRSERRAGHRH